MEFLTFLAIYIGDSGTAGLANCIMLLHELLQTISSMYRRTSTLHICFSFWGFLCFSWHAGPLFALVVHQRLLSRILVCGSSAASSLGNVSHYCCEQRNPVLQLFYLTLLAVSYYLYCRDVFSLLPLPFAPLWHQWTGAGVLGVCLLCFGATSVIDPGTVTKESQEFYQSLYPYDDVTNTEKECNTCHVSKPARSKHCRICKRCIPRFDHHCGWVNNCVGLYNVRFFLAFLLANLVLCVYAVVLLCIVLSGILQKHHLWYERTPWRPKGLPLVRRSAGRLLQWLLVYYPVPTMLLVFLSLGTLMIGCFFAYHCSLIAKGMTSYETFKWQDYKDHCMEMAQESRPATSFKSWQVWSRWCESAAIQRQGKAMMSRNIYNQGFVRNMSDVLFPATVSTANKQL